MIDILIGLVTAWYLTKENKKTGRVQVNDPTHNDSLISYIRPDEDIRELV